jgi:hypothetical protein
VKHTSGQNVAPVKNPRLENFLPSPSLTPGRSRRNFNPAPAF